MSTKIDRKIGVIVGMSILVGLSSFFSYWQYQQVSTLEHEKSDLWTKIWYLNESVEEWKSAHEQKEMLIQGLIKEKDVLYSENSDLQSELTTLKNDYRTLQTQYNNLDAKYGTSLGQQIKLEQTLSVSVQPPYTLIQGREIIWSVKDSKGNPYRWDMPIDSYRKIITLQEPQDRKNLKLADGHIASIRDHTKFVNSRSFANVIDDVYKNAGSDYQFLYEVWYIVSQMTTYSYDIQDDPRWALETFTEGGGDCEDTAILIATMLKSSAHTKNWKIQMIFFDADNPDNPRDVNHVALFVKTDSFKTYVESTAKSDGLQAWKSVNGWYFDL